MPPPPADRAPNIEPMRPIEITALPSDATGVDVPSGAEIDTTPITNAEVKAENASQVAEYVKNNPQGSIDYPSTDVRSKAYQNRPSGAYEDAARTGVEVYEAVVGIKSLLLLLKNPKSILAAFKKIKNIFKGSNKPPSDFLKSLNKKISVQKQDRHVSGTSGRGKGYLDSSEDAQKVLDAVHSGEATFLGTSKAGHQVYKYTKVTGTNVNLGAGISGQKTNVFIIKGTKSPSVVPTTPNWAP